MDADVIVVGAGAAGLAAARQLAERALRVVVVEARERVGGRAWSCPTARAAVPAELGAEFIHGHAPQTMALLREAGMAALDTGGDSWVIKEGVLRRRDDGDFVAAANLFKQASSLREDETVDRFLRRFEGEESMRGAVYAARAFAEGFDAADPAIASAHSIAQEWQSGVDSVSARPLGGYRPMFDYLVSAVTSAGVVLHLSTRVERIEWRRGDVRVPTRAGGDADPVNDALLHARAVVVTLPIGVMRYVGADGELIFDPPLPAQKRAALEKIEMGRVARVVLTFRSAFWERIANERYRDAGFFRNAQGPFAVYWTQLPVRSETIVAWTGGPDAAALSALSQEALVERALEGFGTLLGEPALARAEFEKGVTHDWNRDPFARGAYSYVAVGGGDARSMLAAPLDDTLFFAGEATCDDGQGGTVNGALQTGERAAREVAASLGVT